jgi:FKBP-type peptidyl-prolyl cis-trans isomerase FklB
MKTMTIVASLALCLALVAFAEEAKKPDDTKDPAAKAKDAEPAKEAEPAKTRPELKTLNDKTSYAIGVSIGRNLKAQGYEADLSLVLLGMEDAIEGGKLLLTDQEVQAVLAESRQVLATRKSERMKAAAETNKAAGPAFLVENAKKPGVVTLPSGLQYKVVKEGAGPKPALTDTVTTHYRGTLIDGKEFDSSYGRGEPTSFPVNGVIKGWTEALQLMPVGSKWELYIPSELAYGERGAGQDIGPNATLVFEIELLGIKGK